VAYWQGDMKAALELYSSCLATREELGDPAAIAWARYNLSFAYYLGEVEVELGRPLLDLAVEAVGAAGDRRGEASALWGLAGVEDAAGNADQAWEYGRASLELFRDTDDRFGLGWALRGVGALGTKQGKLAEAREHLTDALRVFHEDDDVSGIVILLGDLAALAEAEGDLTRARRLQGAADGLERTSGTTLTRVLAEFEGWTSDPTAEAYAEGQAMTPEEAVAYALEGGGA
jgi:tetratricopeptide (TPR) repeat protein